MPDPLHEDPARRNRWEEGYRHTRRNLGRRARRIRRLIDAPRNRLLFELGCGDGLNLTVFRDLGFERLIGMDYSFDLVRRSAERTVLVGDGQLLPVAGGAVQTVFVDSVLHHLTDYRAAARECHRVLAPGGRLYYFEPRPSALRAMLDWLTMSRTLDFLPFFASRRETLLEEWSLYQSWLKRHDEFRIHLLETGFRERYRRRGVIGMFNSFEKPSDAASR